MSEQYFLQKCIVSAEDVKGSYTMMSDLDVDPETKQVYTQMRETVSKQLHFLNARLQTLKQNPI